MGRSHGVGSVRYVTIEPAEDLARLKGRPVVGGERPLRWVVFDLENVPRIGIDAELDHRAISV